MKQHSRIARAWGPLLLCLLSSVSSALGPHEIALIVNQAIPASQEVAAHYADLRGVPACNVVEVALPLADEQWEISQDAFREGILLPVQAALDARGLSGQVLAWVYSVGFPARVKAPRAVSLHGATFVRGHLPEPDAIWEATYTSPLFAGGGHEDMRLAMTQSFDGYARWLGEEMPLPSMSLGVVGERASSVEQVKAVLSRAARGDGSRPVGPIYLIDGADVRVTCRRWQFDPTIHALRQAGLECAIVPRVPADAEPLMGIFAGIAQTTPGHYRFLPGALADNLTSFGGAFDVAAQTKLTEWLHAGAAVCAGTVVEPMSNYRKFPVAQIFVHYATGCTAIEAYYQSIASPMQLLLVGDPLAAPYARVTTVECRGVPGDGVVRDAVTVEPSVGDPLRYHRKRYVYLVDGVVKGNGERWRLDPTLLAPGRHTLRIVAMTYGAMRSQSFLDMAFTVPGTQGL
jgi:uncharacterized protein (TIGR03790 family)